MNEKKYPAMSVQMFYDVQHFLILWVAIEVRSYLKLILCMKVDIFCM
jgi:hypothetical protein